MITGKYLPRTGRGTKARSGLVEGFLTRTIRSWRPPLHHSALPNGPAPRSGEVFGRASSPRVVHRRAHPADAVGKPAEDRLPDPKMADIAFAHLADRGENARGSCGGRVGKSGIVSGGDVALKKKQKI